MITGIRTTLVSWVAWSTSRLLKNLLSDSALNGIQDAGHWPASSCLELLPFLLYRAITMQRSAFPRGCPCHGAWLRDPAYRLVVPFIKALYVGGALLAHTKTTAAPDCPCGFTRGGRAAATARGHMVPVRVEKSLLMFRRLRRALHHRARVVVSWA